MRLHNYIKQTILANLDGGDNDRLTDIAAWLDGRSGHIGHSPDNSRSTYLRIGQCPDNETWHDRDTMREVYMSTGDRWRRKSVVVSQEAYDDNYFLCDDCGHSFRDDEDGGHNTSGGRVCARCSNNYAFCNDCGDRFRIDDLDEDRHCSSCHRDSESNGVPDYHDTARNYNIRRGNRELLFGVELEVKAESAEDAFALYEAATDKGFIGEKDGSLDEERGIEIVGPPLSFEGNKESWLKFLPTIRDYAEGWDAGTGYGMHVSVNRRALSVLHQGKFLIFFHHNRKLCVDVAGRESTEWAKYHDHKKITEARYDGDKYEACSLRSSSRIEVRIFRSTTKEEGFLRNLEFTAAAVEFTRHAGLSFLGADCFRRWLNRPENCSQYPNLWRHLNSNHAEGRRNRRANYLKRIAAAVPAPTRAGGCTCATCNPVTTI